MDDIIQLVKQAGQLYLSGDFYGALRLYYKILSDDLGNSVNYYNIGLVYETLQDMELAVSYYKKSIKINPNNVRSINNLARIYIDVIKDYDMVETYLNHAIEAVPNDAEAYNLYGNLSMIREDYELAIAYFKKSILLDENYFKNYYDVAVAQCAINDIDNAKLNLKKSIELNSNFPKAHELLKQIS